MPGRVGAAPKGSKHQMTTQEDLPYNFYLLLRGPVPPKQMNLTL